MIIKKKEEIPDLFFFPLSFHGVHIQYSRLYICMYNLDSAMGSTVYAGVVYRKKKIMEDPC